ncbi:hypothetical protein DLM76_20660 [Leptospira yasudae]|uniref:hypothetical protein n=1 Tax=Leptospira yasudae TaxID=2202201 RepID=UPI000E59D357|nr:hypothetical protein [Leptospira yasudae]RHX90276.1 hypothetical protein DLM76_20660 [Leptospira yasudae]
MNQISEKEIEELRNKVTNLRKILNRFVEPKFSKAPKPFDGNYFVQDADGMLLELSHRDALRIMDLRRSQKILCGDAA